MWWTLACVQLPQIGKRKLRFCYKATPRKERNAKRHGGRLLQIIVNLWILQTFLKDIFRIGWAISWSCSDSRIHKGYECEGKENSKQNFKVLPLFSSLHKFVQAQSISAKLNWSYWGSPNQTISHQEEIAGCCSISRS